VLVWRQLLAAIVLPGTVTIAVPLLILGGDLDLAAPLLVAVGAALIAAGAALWAWTVSLFTTVGRGTLAPWDPTRRLVVSGPYRHVRNPMITGVVTVLLGEALVFGSVGLLAWALAFFLVNAAWFVLVEEPGLVERFGEDYVDYRRRVPRWIPARTALRRRARG
jgi:protein-S-isoprenylcysteine O-methyltransferase Ste14